MATTETRNEAAERLLAGFLRYHNDGPRLLELALAAERSATVERIRARLNRPENLLTSFSAYTPGEAQGFIKAYLKESLDTILDEEASRS